MHTIQQHSYSIYIKWRKYYRITILNILVYRLTENQTNLTCTMLLLSKIKDLYWKIEVWHGHCYWYKVPPMFCGAVRAAQQKVLTTPPQRVLWIAPRAAKLTFTAHCHLNFMKKADKTILAQLQMKNCAF